MVSSFSLLSNPEVLRQLQTIQQHMSQQQEMEDKLRKLQEMKQQEEEFDKHLAQTVPVCIYFCCLYFSKTISCKILVYFCT